MLLLLLPALLQPVLAGDAAPGRTTSEAANLDAVDLDAVDLDEVEGTLPDGAVAAVLKKNAWAVTDCATRLGGRALHGRLEIAWEIGTDGVAAKVVKKESDVKNPSFEACMLTAIGRMKFPAPQGGALHTSHTFSF